MTDQIETGFSHQPILAERSGQPEPIDLESVIAAARDAAERNAGSLPTDAQERSAKLDRVREQLPLAARRASRAELEARCHPKLLKHALAWRWGAGNLILAGKTGAGKTTAAIHLVRRLLSEGARAGGDAFERARSIRWQECRALSAVGREWKLGAGMPDEVFRCQRVGLLVLDDLGATDDKQTLERVLEGRYERGLPTITTTGLRVTDPKEKWDEDCYSAGQLEKALGDALSRRLFECGPSKGTFVEVF
jgi:hypothetical protein